MRITLHFDSDSTPWTLVYYSEEYDGPLEDYINYAKKDVIINGERHLYL